MLYEYRNNLLIGGLLGFAGGVLIEALNLFVCKNSTDIGCEILTLFYWPASKLALILPEWMSIPGIMIATTVLIGVLLGWSYGMHWKKHLIK